MGRGKGLKSIPDGDSSTVSNSTSNGGSENVSSAHGVSTEQSNVPGHNINGLEEKESSCEVVSEKLMRQSDKCVEAVSDITEDSGYMDTSINSMNTSNTHSDLAEASTIY